MGSFARWVYERGRRTACLAISAQSKDVGSGSEYNHITTLITLGHFWFWSLMTMSPEGLLCHLELFSGQQLPMKTGRMFSHHGPSQI